MMTQQLDLFARKTEPRKKTPVDIEATAWCKELTATAESMPRQFWFSELRIKHGREPRVPAWWGMATHALKKLGMMPTDRVRNAPSGYGVRKGGQDRLWTK